MDQTKLENMLACFWSKVTKRINDYTLYVDQTVKQQVTDKLSSIDSGLNEIIEMQRAILDGDE